MPKRHGQADSYRYGFQGQEKDDEIKGEGNTINFKFRMYDSRVGRFLSIDPMFSEYPWNSTYAFAENKLGLGTELEGRELKYINGKLVYVVQAGQGPSQIAEDINKQENKEKFGYATKNLRVYAWFDIVKWNVDTYKEKGRYQDPSDINDVGYTELNINPGDILNVNLHNNMEKVSLNNNPLPKSSGFTAPYGGIDVNGTTPSGVGASFSMNSFTVPKETMYWERGLSVEIFTTSGALGTPGADVGMGGGWITFDSSTYESISSVLNKSSVSGTGGFIGPLGFGGKITVTKGDGYRSTLPSFAFGTPGPIIGGTSSDAAIQSKIVVKGLQTRSDSIRAARSGVEAFGSKNHFGDYLKKIEETKEEVKQ